MKDAKQNEWEADQNQVAFSDEKKSKLKTVFKWSWIIISGFLMVFFKIVSALTGRWANQKTEVTRYYGDP